MWLGFIRRSHYHNCITKRVTNSDLATLVLVRVESIELLEFVINVGRHDQANIPVRWPVGSLQALNGEVEV